MASGTGTILENIQVTEIKQMVGNRVDQMTHSDGMGHVAT